MPELRKDPVVGRWVIIATERARRPGNFIDRTYLPNQTDPRDCPYCHLTERPIYQHKGGISVVPFRGSFLAIENTLQRKTHGLYDILNTFGVHEVVVETSEHIDNMSDLTLPQIQGVFETYANRMEDLQNDENLMFITAYKNFGSAAGSRLIEHARSHIMSTPVNPQRFKDKLSGARKYFKTHRSCVYCDLIRQELKEKSRVILESEHFICFIPFAARYLFEIWIVPKKHNCDFYKSVKGVEADLAMVMKNVLNKCKAGLEEPAYNYIINTAPFRRKGLSPERWNTIDQDFHWHIELTPRLTQLAGFEKGTGFYICAIAPEMMAEYLRGIEV